MKKIPLTRNKFALVDNSDFEWLNQWKWCYKVAKILSDGTEKGIAVTANYQSSLKQNRLLKMHRLIMSAPKDMTVDHINGDTLDNRRSNLRLATLSQNNKNKRSVNYTGFKNVYFVPNYTTKWYAKIMVDRKSIHLGTFETPEEAALAYNEAATKYHGEFARLNQI